MLRAAQLTRTEKKDPALLKPNEVTETKPAPYLKTRVDGRLRRLSGEKHLEVRRERRKFLNERRNS